MPRRNKDMRELARLRAFDKNGALVEEQVLSIHSYYDDDHDLIDSDEYRACRGIVLLSGELYDLSGMLDQEFANRYSADGSYVGGRAVHSDGAVF